ncbi:MAG: hypothetical protein D6730_25330, partial [Bacteroidetes bacterium]
GISQPQQVSYLRHEKTLWALRATHIWAPNGAMPSMTRSAGKEVAGGCAACPKKLPSFSRRGWGWLIQVAENE